MDSAEAQRPSPDKTRTANYLVNSYNDLRDIVMAVEKIIQDTTEIRDKTVLRKGCRLSVIPLKDRSSFILKVILHQPAHS